MLGSLMRKLAGLGPTDPLPPPAELEPPPAPRPVDPDAIVFARMAGRCANGAERDGGSLFHVVRNGRALCGAAPGRQSAGWSSHPGTAATCQRCARKLKLTAVPKAGQLMVFKGMPGGGLRGVLVTEIVDPVLGKRTRVDTPPDGPGEAAEELFAVDGHGWSHKRIGYVLEAYLRGAQLCVPRARLHAQSSHDD